MIPLPDCSPVVRVGVRFDGDVGLNITWIALLAVVHFGKDFAVIPHIVRQTREILHLT